MEKINVAVIGYGNIGKYAVEAVNAAPDMHLAGIVRRSMGSSSEINAGGIKITDDIKNLGKVDVALLCCPSRSVPEMARKYLSMGINTVDSYDIHSSIYDVRCDLEAVAKENNAVAVVSAGWDPGSDSLIRAFMDVLAPKGITYTNFGPGMSMGHSVAAKGKDGVADAMSLTVPMGTGVHRRMVYVELEPDADFDAVSGAIKTDPYFVHDETVVIKVDNINAIIDKGHGVNMVRKGVSGETHNQLLEFNMKINNPALTSQIMVACARASVKRKPGAYTMIEIPVVDMLDGGIEGVVRKYV